MRTTSLATLPLAALAPPAMGAELALSDVGITPRHAYFAGAPVRIAFAVDGPAPAAVRVRIVRAATGKTVAVRAAPATAPVRVVRWDGLTAAGEVAPNGTYRVRVVAGRARADAGTFTLRSHVYPVRGAHRDRGPVGAFGVARNGGRTHEGFDVDAACGTPLVAARGGRVVRSTYDPVLYGHLVVVRGERTQRDYWYAHLARASALRRGDRVRTGGAIGRVGATGNARTVGCHLHFEIRRRGVPIDPAPELHAWDAWS